MITIKTIPDQWNSFINEYFSNRLRLKALLAKATFKSEGTQLFVLVPVYHIMQEEWLKNGTLPEISKSFIKYCHTTSRKVSLVLERDADFEKNTNAIFQTPSA